MSEEMENEVRKEASRILEAAGIDPKVVETCVNLSIDGYKTAERVLVPRLIDSACEWLDGNLHLYVLSGHINYTFLLHFFREAMKTL